MLFDSSEILKGKKKKSLECFPFDKLFPTHIDFVGQPWEILSKHIGKIEPNSIINFWTFGRFNMSDIINYILRQTGTCKINACTWAISIDAVNTILY
jgi:hypothetical protein